MAGYSRSFNRANGEIIEAPDFVNEFEALDTAFDQALGHRHDGSAGSGGWVNTLSNTTNTNEILIDGANQQILFSVNVTGVKTTQFRIIDGVIEPSVNDDVDLGSLSKQFKDIYAAGTANLAVLQLATGSAVSAIYDQDDMLADSDTGLATQQSIKKYVDDVALAHVHDGVAGSIVNFIASDDERNVFEVDDLNNKFILSVDVGAVKTNKLSIDSAAILPSADNGLILGGASNRFSQAWINQIRADNLQFAIGVNADAVLDDDTMAANSASALVTQQSIKAYVDGLITAHSHDGLDSVTLDKIQSPDGYNRVFVNDGANRIVFQIDVASVTTSKAAVDATALYPASDLDINLGKPTFRFVNGYVQNLYADGGTIVRQTVPATAIGASGDLAGMIAADSSHVYLCHTDYDGVSSIWSRVAIATW